MKINQIVELMQGELKNIPAVDSFDGVSFSLSGLKKGSLFFARNNNEIDAAVSMGAYGIVYEQEVSINDNEIAWIRVKDLQESLMRLLRFFLLTKEIDAFCLKDREFEIFSQICTDSSTFCHSSDLEVLLEKIFNSNLDIKHIVFPESKPLEYLLDFTPSIVPQKSDIDVRVATLFDMRFYYKLSQYHLYLPVLFINDLKAVLYFCETYHIDFDLNLFSKLESVCPNFIDFTPKLLEYGESERVVIAQEQFLEFKRYAEYIASNGKWGKVMLFVPQECCEEFLLPAVKYQDNEELIKLLGKEQFNFGLIFGIKNEVLIELLKNNVPKVALSLFDEF